MSLRSSGKAVSQDIKNRRNIILPNFITLMGLLCGMYSMVAVADGRLVAGAYAILLAIVFDSLDGKVARLVNGTSEFGIQLDSLADVISFGVAPAFLMYQWHFEPYKQAGMMAMFLYVACGALRLARFNVQTKTISNIFFVGLPIPAAAGVIASGVLIARRFGIMDAHWLSNIAIVFVFMLAFLMVSTVPFFSFKKMGFFRAKPFNMIVILVIIVFFAGLAPAISLFILAMVYLFSGFALIPFRKRLIKKMDAGDLK